MTVALVIALWLAAAAQNSSGPDLDSAGRASSAHDAGPIKEALRSGNFPWYDAETDSVKPVSAPRMSWLKSLQKTLRSSLDAIFRSVDRFIPRGAGGGPISGNAIATALLLAALMAFFAVLVFLWLRRDDGRAPADAPLARLGGAARMDDLPEGLRPGAGDPWDEAKRRRAAGDLSGAIVALFAHQLLTLDRLGLIRLSPGKTGRHYVYGIRQHPMLEAPRATLPLFEDVYYGQRSPSRAAFERVWKGALDFQDRCRSLGAGASE